MADGSLGRALELLEGDLKTWRQAVLAGLERFSSAVLPRLRPGPLWSIAEVEGERLFKAEKEAEKDAEVDDTENEDGEGSEAEQKTESGWKRFVFRRMLELNEICFRDALVASAGSLDGATIGAPAVAAGSAETRRATSRKVRR